MTTEKQFKLIHEISHKCALLAMESDYELGVDVREHYGIYYDEYISQLKVNEHNSYLRIFVGYMIEQGNKNAISIMKSIIRYNFIYQEV